MQISEPQYRFLERLDDQQTRELHALYQGESWTCGRGLEDVKEMLQHSTLVCGFCDESDGRLVAFARILTDTVFKAFVFDVIVAPDHRHEGIGKRLVDHIVQHPLLRHVRHLELYCFPEMVPFYEKFGFSTQVSGVCLMRKTAERK